MSIIRVLGLNEQRDKYSGEELLSVVERMIRSDAEIIARQSV